MGSNDEIRYYMCKFHNAVAFQVTKMPEVLRNLNPKDEKPIAIVNSFAIRSAKYVDINLKLKRIFLRGCNTKLDLHVCIIRCNNKDEVDKTYDTIVNIFESLNIELNKIRNGSKYR